MRGASRRAWSIAAAVLVTSCGAVPVRPESPGSLYTLIDARAPDLTAAREATALCKEVCALVYVDGFNNSLAESKANFAGVGRAYADGDGLCRMFGYTWPSDVGVTHFTRAEARAEREAARTLAEILAGAHDRCPTHPVHLVGHSLGARVILASLAGGSTKVSSVALAVPAVPDDALLPSGEFAAAASRVERLAVYYNAQDYFVMAMLYPLFSRAGARPLGLYGSRSTALLPVNVRQFDRSVAWGPRHSALVSFDRAFWEEHGRTLAPSRTWVRWKAFVP